MRLVIDEHFCPQVVVVAHGSLSDDAETLRLLRDAVHVVVCDGALERYAELTQRRPDAVVGDGDSVQDELLERMGLKLIQMEDQELNDLTKAVYFALDQGWRSIAIVGGTGKREDHSIGNVAHLTDFYFEKGAEVRMISQYGALIPFEGVVELHLERGRQLSFFALSEKPMSAEGVVYEFRERQFSRLWEATLNEALGGEVQVKSGGPAMIYISNEVKKR